MCAIFVHTFLPCRCARIGKIPELTIRFIINCILTIFLGYSFLTDFYIRTASRDYYRITNAHNASKQCQFRQNLKKVLLAINFNHAFYDNIPTLRKFYEPQFGKVVFCGFKANATYGVLKMNNDAGMQAYHCLALAIKNHSTLGFEGYFFSNDDVILNYWNLNFDLGKVWLGTPVKWHYVHEIGGAVSKKWVWWHDGAPRCEKVFRMLTNMTKPTDKTLADIKFKSKLKKHLQIYFANSHNKNLCMMSWSDAFYVPKKHSTLFAFLANIFEKELVFLEIASPMILHMLAGPNDLFHMHGVYHADNELGHGAESFYKTYTYDITFSHPFKLSSRTNKKFFDMAIVPHALKMVTRCDIRESSREKSQNSS